MGDSIDVKHGIGQIRLFRPTCPFSNIIVYRGCVRYSKGGERVAGEIDKRNEHRREMERYDLRTDRRKIK